MDGFSHAVTHYSSVFPERTGDYILQLLPENLYQQMTLGTVSSSVRAGWMWLFPMAHSIPWVHYEKYLSRPVFPIAGSYLYLCVICTALALASLFAARGYQAGRG